MHYYTTSTSNTVYNFKKNIINFFIVDPRKIDDDFFIQWLKKAVHIWNTTPTPIPTNILSFAANLISSLIGREIFFLKIKDFLENFVEIMRTVPESAKSLQIKINYVNFISTFLQHSVGLKWLMNTHYWFDIVTMAFHTSVTELNLLRITFILNLLEESCKLNEVFCRTAIQMMVAPLIDLSMSVKDKDVSLIETKAIQDNLYLLNKVLEGLVDQSCTTRDFTVLNILLDDFALEKTLNEIIPHVTHEETFLRLNYIHNAILYCITARYWAVRGFLETQENINKMIALAAKKSAMVMAIFERRMPYRTIYPLIKRMHLFGKSIYENMHAGATFQDDVKKRYIIEKYQNQLMLIFLWPIINLVAPNIICECDELRDRLTSKIINSMELLLCNATKEAKGYVDRFTVEDATKALENLKNCSSFYKLSVANTVTQILIYRFQHILNELDNYASINFWSQEFMSQFIDTLVLFLKRFNLSWNDSIETVYVTDIATQFLNQPFWTPRVSRCKSKRMSLIYFVSIGNCKRP